ncbi:MAG: hypothetical protein AVDCRST_MAG33-3000 [uncultured Thermomicrobiales bacterium]|uniref:Uncharacterized protein n=1 Tax=uncultured Thermomicrobiales bacterium TaxID=1645740 RepID=A0A6J4VGT8_9BACT|nr:MAG: hypothetical protein AVDCRST_MAG33-3000 [uncultured Thermomicrobiales bacterium]
MGIRSRRTRFSKTSPWGPFRVQIRGRSRSECSTHDYSAPPSTSAQHSALAQKRLTVALSAQSIVIALIQTANGVSLVLLS